MNFRYKLSRFLYGRYLTYGIDTLTIILTVLCLIFSFVNIFLSSILLYLSQTALFIFMFYRLLSRNITKRKAENMIFTKFSERIKASKQLKSRKKADKNTHIYKKCPHCKVILRLPRLSGKHIVKCP